MVLYKVFKVLNGEEIFTGIPHKEKKIVHPKFKYFKIKNKDQYIVFNAADSVESIFSTELNQIYDEVNIEVIIARYKFLYSVVKLSGRGLLSIHGLSKYIDVEILSHIEKYIKDNFNINIGFESFEYDNNHFSKDYWGENITTKLGYNSSNRMYIKISSPNFEKLIAKYPDLENYYTNGIIKSIKGRISDLEYIEDNKKYPGNFKFNRNGVFSCDFSNIIFFNDFLKKFINKGFFGSY